MNLAGDVPSIESAHSKLLQSIKQYPDEEKTGEYYLKVMKKISEKGNTFVETEISRLQKLLEGHLTGDKRDEMYKRMNVLNVFKSAIFHVEL